MPKQLRAKKFRRVNELLRDYYGPVGDHSGAPLDTLIRTILSQNTTDVNSIPAFERLREHFGGDWERALEAGPEAIEEQIEQAGLAPTKSRRIHAILRELKQQRGELSLQHICEMEPEEAEAYLLDFPGVGPKTAAIVLLFDCEMPFFPVDTHVHRIAKRLSWIDEKDDAVRTYEILTEAVPEELHYPLHLNLVRHGRETCRPSRPDCNACPISRFCEAYRSGEVEPRES